MNPAAILEEAERAGVTIAVSLVGGIKASGDQNIVDQFIPILRENKAELIKFLQQPLIELKQPKPFIVNGELRIPLNCDPRYKWWSGGQSIFKTLLELGASDEVVKAYIGEITSPEDWRRWQKIKENRQASRVQ